MKPRWLLVFFACVCLTIASARAQGSGSTLSDLSQKIDAQNAKIDALSQQILKLQQTIEQGKGSTAPTTVGVSEETPAASAIPVGSGNTHVVARGETLTSIAKHYKVGIDELQKFNHIEDARKLQLGQTLMIPGAATPSPTATPNE
ncbi:MAG: LysM peptidoglycan-binding domain-containing protein [Chthoniobacterales bacterium]|nr:LysM peptidoglycan-binding domain-containing protein [Chthoniobacterales bacterium]